MTTEYTLDDLINIAARSDDPLVRRLAVKTAYALGKRDQHTESFIERWGKPPAIPTKDTAP